MLPAAIIEGTKITPIFSAEAKIIKGLRQQANIFELWPASELAAIGVYPLVRAPAVKTYFGAGATLSYSFAGGVVTEVRADTRMLLADAKKVKLAEINGKLEGALSALVSAYPPLVRETWGWQEKEAEGFASAAPTPRLSRMATARGITVAQLVLKINAKVNIRGRAEADILGAAQKRQDAVKAARNFVEFRAVP